MSISVQQQVEIMDCQREAEAITAKPKISKEDRTRFEFLMGRISLLRSGQLDDSVRRERAKQLAIETGAYVDPSTRMRSLVTGESRTYSPWNITTASGAADLIPTEFEQRLVELQMAAGPLYAGSAAISNIETSTAGPMKMPVTDDTEATGFVQAENQITTEAEFSLSQTSMATKTFSSGIVQFSAELSEDVASWASLEKILQNALAKRLGRIQNSTFLASLMTTLTANTSASVSAADAFIENEDLINLVAACSAQYRYSDKAGFLLNTSTAKAIALLKDSQNRPLYRKILSSKPELMQYPVYISDFADDVASGKHPILFGDWSYVFCRHVPSFELQVLNERYIDQGSKAIIARKRADLQYSVPSTSDSAIKMLTFS